MKINEQTHAVVPVSALLPHPRNPRQGDVGVINESIRENGFYGTVIVQKSTGYVLAGNHRLLAAKQQGAQEVPVTFLDVDDETALRILLVDNRSNDLAHYDTHALVDLLQEIMHDVGSLDGTGYDGDALDELISDLNGITEEPKAVDESKAADQYICVVSCQNESELQSLYTELTERGLSCKLVM